MFKKLRVKKVTKIMIVGVMLIAVIGFADREQEDNVCQEIVINIKNQYDNFFVDEHDLHTLMTQSGEYPIKGVPFGELNLKEIEERTKTNKFIRKVEIYKDLKGTLLVNAELRRPFARIINDKGPDAYVAMDGTLLPTSIKFAARVVLVSGSYTQELLKDNLLETETGVKVYELIKFINNDKFWKAQIAQIEIDKNKNVIMYPQVTKQYIEYGNLDDMESKFQRLKIFYKQILPQKGWNKYERVNLQYEGQIVAE